MVIYFIKSRTDSHPIILLLPSLSLSDQVQSQPIGSDKSIVSHVEVVNDTVTDGDTVPIAQVQSQPVVSLKWQKYKADINKRRREKID